MDRNCFTVMPFDSRFEGVWLNVIKPTIENHGDNCLRADNFFKVGSILDDIITSIKEVDYIIADLTIHNPNVYYELGYSHALEKKVILITQDISSIPFDLKHQRMIVYQDTAAGAAKLKSDISNFINQI